MKIHYCIEMDSEKQLRVTFVNEKHEILSGVTVTFTRSKSIKPWRYESITASSFSLSCASIVRYLAKEHGPNIECPYDLVAIARQSGGSQLAYDPQSQVFRNAKIADKTDKKLYSSTINEKYTFAIEAEDEEKGTRRIVAAVQKAMVDNPQDAQDLAAFFSNGMKVEESEIESLEVVDEKAILNPGQKWEKVELKKTRKYTVNKEQ